jgi:predicted RNA-binding protein (virulence factor B family)
MEVLKERGSIMLTDKSSPESIKRELKMSKKAFKKAVGFLYKRKLIVLLDDRIELVKTDQ